MRSVYFVVLPQLVLLDLAGPAEAFRLAEALVPASYQLRFIGPGRRARTAVGLQLEALEPLPRSVAADSIIVLNGVSGTSVALDDAPIRSVISWLKSGVTAPAVLACVCAGSVLAGKAGLLAGRECTTHHAHIEELRSVAPDARVLDNRIFVEDGRLLTSAGVTAGVDLALHIIGQQLGPRAAANVARDLVVYLRRAGTDPALSPWVQHRNHLHPVVHRVQDAVSRRPTDRWSARTLATLACTSPRNLTRLFAQHANCSPVDYVQLIRFAFARELVAQSTLDLERIAARTGFRSAQQLRRTWARWEKQTPSAYRQACGAGALPAQTGARGH